MSAQGQLPPRPSYYAIVIALNKEEALMTAKRIAPTAIRNGRLWVLNGNSKTELFPTAELKSRLVRFLNRGNSAERQEDRVREIAIVFFSFFPPRVKRDSPVYEGTRLAEQAGFDSKNIQVFRANSHAELIEALRALGHADPIPGIEPTSLFEALEMFGNEFQDVLVSARALESAKDWECPAAQTILNELRVVHRTYGQLVDVDGNPIDAQDRKRILTEAGVTLAWESQSVTKKHRTAVFAELEGRTVSFASHLRYSHHYTRIYLWFAPLETRDQEKIKTLVAHAGKHLPGGRDR